MRVTRAAQRAQQDAEVPIEAPEANERVLKAIELNTSPSDQTEESLHAKTPAKTPAKKAKGKSGRKGAKSKKASADEVDSQVAEEVEQQAIASSLNEAAEREPIQGYEDSE